MEETTHSTAEYTVMNPDKEPSATNAPTPAPAPPLTPTAGAIRTSRQRALPLIIALIVVILGIVAAYYFIAVRPYETTDDAFIDGHAIQISPQVSGRVLQVLIHDNQLVKKGDPLVQIDPRDYEAALAQARANLAAAQSHLGETRQQVIVSRAKAEQDRAAVSSAEADAKLADADLARYQAVEKRSISQQQLDAVTATAQSSQASLEVARKKADASAAQVGQDEAQVPTADAGVQQAEAALRQAELNRSYADIVAPEDGWVTRRVVESGQYVQVGQALLAVVQPNVWITANFKETQLAHMTAGQPVWIKVDAFPQKKFKGHVDSIQAGTGAQFSLLPPENAAGNYVKVVQRVPVKIVFDDNDIPQLMLPLGASVVPEVKVR
jgi:membrane fusion protein, multidrug efflux system